MISESNSEEDDKNQNIIDFESKKKINLKEKDLNIEFKKAIKKLSEEYNNYCTDS